MADTVSTIRKTVDPKASNCVMLSTGLVGQY